MPGNASHAELLGILEVLRGRQVVGPHIVIRRLFVKSFEPVGESADVMYVLHEAGDVAGLLVVPPDHGVDVDVAGLVTHTLARLRQLKFDLTREDGYEGLRRTIAHDVIAFEDLGAELLAHVAIRARQFSCERVA